MNAYIHIHLQHLQNAGMNAQVVKFAPNLIQGALDLHSKMSSTFLPTAIKFHYIFNLRDLSNIFQVFWELDILAYINFVIHMKKMLLIPGCFVLHPGVCEEYQWPSVPLGAWSPACLWWQDGWTGWHWALQQNSERDIQEIIWRHWGWWYLQQESSYLLSLCSRLVVHTSVFWFFQSITSMYINGKIRICRNWRP